MPFRLHPANRRGREFSDYSSAFPLSVWRTIVGKRFVDAEQTNETTRSDHHWNQDQKIAVIRDEDEETGDEHRREPTGIVCREDLFTRSGRHNEGA